MKILAIRGQNLASLAAPFEIHLDGQPLDSARIFAVVGPTGSGKSTLLDAMCLALFHQTPRLTGKGKNVSIGESEGDGLSSRDPRSLLRRGASSAFAECEFEGVDGRRYRAKWSVRRARNSPAGKLQPVSSELECLDDGTRIGRKKREIVEAIQQRLGVGFEQFRRGVMLAQGDFTAFLKASEDERSSLLEQMTSTDIYSHLSRAAHERKRLWDQELREVSARLDVLRYMDDDARQTLELSLDTLLLDHNKLVQTIQGERKRREYYRQWVEKEQLLGAAKERLRRLREEEAQAAEQRSKLAQLDAIDTLTPAMNEAEQALIELKKAQKKLSENRKKLDRQKRQERLSREQVDKKKHKLAAFIAKQPAFEASIEVRRELEARLSEAALREVTAKETLDKADEAQKEANLAAKKAQKGLGEFRRTLALAKKWHAAYPYRGLELRLVRQHLSDLEAHQAEVDVAAERHLDLELQIQGHLRDLAWQTQMLRREEDPVAHTSVTKPLELAGFEKPLAEVRELHVFLERVEDAAARASEAAERLASLQREAQETADAQDVLTAKYESAEAEFTKVDAKMAAARTLLVEAQHLHEEAKNASFADTLRGHLVDGEPCPVCASTEHSQFPHEPHNGTALEEARTMLAKREQELSLAEITLETARSIKVRLGTELSAISARVQEQQVRLSEGRLSQAKLENECAERWAAYHTLKTRLIETLVTLGEPFLELSQKLNCKQFLENNKAQPSEQMPKAMSSGELRIEESPFEPRRRLNLVTQKLDLLRSEAEAEATQQQKAARRDHLVKAAQGKTITALSLLLVERGRTSEEHARLKSRCDELSRRSRDFFGDAVTKPASGSANNSSNTTTTNDEHRQSGTKDEAANTELQASAPSSSALTAFLNDEASADLSPKIDALIEQVRSAESEVEKLGEALKTQQNTLNTELEQYRALTTKREKIEHKLRGVLGGKSVSEARKERSEAQAQLTETLSDSEKEQRLAADLVLSASASIEERSRTIESMEQAASTKTRTLGRALMNLGVTPTQARALTRDTDTTTLRTSLRDLDRRVAQAAAHVDQRQSDFKAHKKTRATFEPTESRQATHSTSDMSEDDMAQLSLFDVMTRSENEAAKSLENATTPPEKQLAQEPVKLTLERLEASIVKQEETLEEQREALLRMKTRLEDDKLARNEHAELIRRHDEAISNLEIATNLSELIGSASGKKFRKFAQSVTLDILLARASVELEKLHSRYAIERIRDSDMGIQLVDYDMGGTVRSVETLSGGESFIVALALALALASLSLAEHAGIGGIRTLFIDEGFGALDAASLDRVLDVLDEVQAEGRQIGVISHVDEIAERFPVQIRVSPLGNGRSEVHITPEVEACTAFAG